MLPSKQNCFVLWIEPCNLDLFFTLQDIRTGERISFDSWQALQDYIQKVTKEKSRKSLIS